MEEFSNHSGFKDGKNSKCKSCKNKNAAKFYESKKYDEKWMENNRQRWRKNRSWFTSKYKISLADYEKMYNDQKGKCYICGTYQERLCQDHCHKTKKNRKLLCANCNVGLGHFKENIEFLENAIKYLNEYLEV